MTEYEKRERELELMEEWIDGRSNRTCTCMFNPPCSYCVDGLSLSLEEYIEINMEPYDVEPDAEPEDTHSDYDRAMEILK